MDGNLDVCVQHPPATVRGGGWWCVVAASQRLQLKQLARGRQRAGAVGQFTHSPPTPDPPSRNEHALPGQRPISPSCLLALALAPSSSSTHFPKSANPSSANSGRTKREPRTVSALDFWLCGIWSYRPAVGSPSWWPSRAMAEEHSPAPSASATEQGARQLSLESLAGEHRRVFYRATATILATDVAEVAYAQIIDGCPIEPPRHASTNALPIRPTHTELCPGMLEKAREFRDQFYPDILVFDFKVSSIFSCP